MISTKTFKPLQLEKICKQLYLQLERVLSVNLKCPMMCECISVYWSTTALRLGKIDRGGAIFFKPKIYFVIINSNNHQYAMPNMKRIGVKLWVPG